MRFLHHFLKLGPSISKWSPGVSGTGTHMGFGVRAEVQAQCLSFGHECT